MDTKNLTLITILFMAASLVNAAIAPGAGPIIMFVAASGLLAFLVYVERGQINELKAIRAEVKEFKYHCTKALTELDEKHGKAIEDLREQVKNVTLAVNNTLGF